MSVLLALVINEYFELKFQIGLNDVLPPFPSLMNHITSAYYLNTVYIYSSAGIYFKLARPTTAILNGWISYFKKHHPFFSHPFFPNTAAMFTIPLQTVIVFAILYALWKLQRHFFIKLALDNIPGPPSQSFLFGEFFELVLIFESAILSFYLIFRCFPSAFQYQRMGISQIY